MKTARISDCGQPEKSQILSALVYDFAGKSRRAHAPISPSGAQVKEIDLLVSARWVIPVEPAESVLEHHSVAVAAGRIVAVLPTPEAERGYRAARRVDLPNHALMPGLVNLHTHAAMTLMRGLADDLPLMTWLRDHVWPAETKHVSPEFVYDGTL